MTSPYEIGIGRAKEILGQAGTVRDDAGLAELSVELARALLEASNAGTEPNERERADRIAALLDDPVGQAFVSALTDRAHRSSEGARLVEEVEGLVLRLGVPRSLPGWDRLQLRALQVFGSSVPELTARAVRRRIHEDAAPYLAPADRERLAAFLRERSLSGLSVNVNHLGEEVLGDRDAERYLETYLDLLARPEVRTISVKLSSIDPRVDVVAWEQTQARLGEKLARIYAAALEHSVRDAAGRAEPKLVYLDMEAYRDLELTLELFLGVLERPELSELTAGIVLQAYVPDSHAAQARLLGWARARVERGGAPIRMRLVKGANLMMERVEASLRGFELATYSSKSDVDASFRRMLRCGTLHDNARAVHLGVGSHNLFDIAYALLLRERRGVAEWVEPEMLEGMADPLRRVVQRVAGRVLVYAPSVDARDFPTAVAYLVRRLDENTSEENFLRHSFGMHAGDASFETERERFQLALAASEFVGTLPFRTQDRRSEPVLPVREAFENEPDTDFSQRANREWLLAKLEAERTREPFVLRSRIDGQELDGAEQDGFDPSRPGLVPYRVRELGRDEVVRAIERAHAARAAWANVPAGRREEILLTVAHELRCARGELIGRMVLDAGKRAVEADTEVSEAIDFAEYYARQHARLRGRFALEPKGLVVVTPPWNFPLSIGLGGTLAALVAGNVVLLKPPPETPLVLASAVELCLRAGVPADALGLVLTNDEAAEPLVTDPRVAALVLTGGTETARLFRRLRPDIDLIAETGGKNALIVSAMSDREQAIANALRAAFGHAGQKCSALSLLILEREVYRSASFKKKLADAVSSLAVGSAWELESVVTPLIRPPEGALARALGTLEPGESWLVEPAHHPSQPRLWGPSVRWDVQPQSFTHTTELFGPVLAVLEARDFDHALEIANGTPYGLTAGLESLDAREHAAFLERMEAGNLYVNRPVTGAVAGRQPFGGHKASSFGPGFKAGGPNTLLALVHVSGELGRPSVSDPALSRGPRAHVPQAKAGAPRPPPDLGVFGEFVADELRDAERPEQERLARRLRSYEAALLGEIDLAHPQDQVFGHEDSLVYRPCRAGIVVLAGVDEIDLLSTLVAAHMVGAEVELYAEERAGAEILRLLGEDLELFESLDELEELVREGRYERVRILGDGARDAFRALGDAAPSLDVDPVSDAGYIELRRYVIEQTRSVALHRYGNMSLYLAQRARERSQERT